MLEIIKKENTGFGDWGYIHTDEGVFEFVFAGNFDLYWC